MLSNAQRNVRWYKSINFKIVMVIVILIVFALEIIGANFINQLEDELVTTHKTDRQTQLDFIETSAEPYLAMLQEQKENEGDPTQVDPLQEINALLSDFSGHGNINIEIVSPNLSIVGTSLRTNQNLVGQRTNDTDVRQVLLSQETITREYIHAPTNERRWKVVTPIQSDQANKQLLGVIMMESNIETVYQQINSIGIIFIQASLLAIAISVILAYALAKEIVNPIIEIEDTTRMIADGDYSINLKNDNNDEIGHLAHSINVLARRVSSAQSSIDAERRRLNRVLTHMSDGVIATNRRGRVVITNSKAREMLNIDDESAIGMPILELLDIEDVTIDEFYEDPEKELMIEHDERFIRLTFSIIELDGQTVQGVVCVLHDVTEAENMERDRRTFVSNVSHELRTPLTSMRSYVEALNDGAWKDENIAPQFLNVIQNETNRMIRMVTDLLQLSRIDTGNENFEKELVDITALFNFVLDRFEMVIDGDKKFDIKRSLPNEEAWAEVDQDRIVQVLDNIMNNAIKYSPDGGVIEAKMSIREHDLLISISDQGMGIAKQELPRIFFRFYRVDKARSRAMGGTGLGLAIAKEVVDLHDGRIWVRSKLNQGTCFYLTLPLADLTWDDEWDDEEAWD